MGFREDDEVVATHAMTNSVTGNAVRTGGRGVVVKQIGARPATYRVRFDSSDGGQQSLILDDVTDHDIAPVTSVNPDADIQTKRDLYFWPDSAS